MAKLEGETNAPVRISLGDEEETRKKLFLSSNKGAPRKNIKLINALVLLYL